MISSAGGKLLKYKASITILMGKCQSKGCDGFYSTYNIPITNRFCKNCTNKKLRKDKLKKLNEL